MLLEAVRGRDRGLLSGGVRSPDAGFPAREDLAGNDGRTDAEAEHVEANERLVLEVKEKYGRIAETGGSCAPSRRIDPLLRWLLAGDVTADRLQEGGSEGGAGGSRPRPGLRGTHPPPGAEARRSGSRPGLRRRPRRLPVRAGRGPPRPCDRSRHDPGHARARSCERREGRLLPTWSSGKGASRPCPWNRPPSMRSPATA